MNYKILQSMPPKFCGSGTHLISGGGFISTSICYSVVAGSLISSLALISILPASASSESSVLFEIASSLSSRMLPSGISDANFVLWRTWISPSSAAVGFLFFFISNSLTSAGVMAFPDIAFSTSAGKVHHDMWMCMSIRPDRNRAGSSFSMWLVVNIMIRSLPQHDHSPSVKLSNPESVTRLICTMFKNTTQFSGSSSALHTIPSIISSSKFILFLVPCILHIP